MKNLISSCHLITSTSLDSYHNAEKKKIENPDQRDDLTLIVNKHTAIGRRRSVEQWTHALMVLG